MNDWRHPSVRLREIEEDFARRFGRLVPVRLDEPHPDSTRTPEHAIGGFCWCQPRVQTDPVTGNHLFIHRRSIDSPHIEPVP